MRLFSSVISGEVQPSELPYWLGVQELDCDGGQWNQQIRLQFMPLQWLRSSSIHVILGLLKVLDTSLTVNMSRSLTNFQLVVRNIYMQMSDKCLLQASNVSSSSRAARTFFLCEL